MCICTFVGADIVYMLYDNTGDTYMHYVYVYAQCMTCILSCVYSILYVLKMLLRSIARDGVVAAAFSIHLENSLVSCGCPRFSTAVS